MKDKNWKDEYEGSKDTQRALLQMYQAGFLDGSKSRWNKKTKNACIKAFNIRFMPLVKKEMEKKKDEI